MTGHFVYILKCDDETLYTGYTTDIDQRVQTHNAQQGAKYTRGRTPVTVVYHERHSSRSQAMQREYAIKSLSRTEKLQLIQTGNAEDYPPVGDNSLQD